jgi:hypothetical protein
MRDLECKLVAREESTSAQKQQLTLSKLETQNQQLQHKVQSLQHELLSSQKHSLQVEHRCERLQDQLAQLQLTRDSHLEQASNEKAQAQEKHLLLKKQHSDTRELLQDEQS